MIALRPAQIFLASLGLTAWSVAALVAAPLTPIEGTESPNGKYFVAYEDTDSSPNYIAEGKSAQGVIKIGNVTYFPGMNHGSLDVDWDKSSKSVILTYGSKWGTDSLEIVTLGDEPQDFNAQPAMEQALEALLKKKGKDENSGGMVCEVRARWASGGKVMLVAHGLTNPKEMENYSPSVDLVARGIFSFAAGKVTVTETKIVKSEQVDAAMSLDAGETSSAGSDSGPDSSQHLVEPTLSMKEQLAAADVALNDAYGELREKLSPAAQEKLKTAQKAWLVRRDAITSPSEKLAFVFARVEELSSQAEAISPSSGTGGGKLTGDLAKADADLNAAYTALKKKLSAAAQEKLKAEQNAWLKERDACGTDEEKLYFVQSRVEDLKARANAIGY